jgi:TRAP-type C4-dicarboxylate transport system permease large subunit
MALRRFDAAAPYYTIVWSLRNRDLIPPADINLDFRQKLAESRHLIPIVLLILAVLGSIYAGIATATEAAALGVVGALILSAFQRTLTWATFRDSLLAATRLYSMIALILAGAAFLALSMGFIGLPRQLAEAIGALQLPPFALIMLLMVFFIVLGCFLDGISMVVLTMAVLLPTLQTAHRPPGSASTSCWSSRWRRSRLRWDSTCSCCRA